MKEQGILGVKQGFQARPNQIAESRYSEHCADVERRSSEAPIVPIQPAILRRANDRFAPILLQKSVEIALEA
ncbi:hypothetical protein ACFIOY_22915 [Bradyrhizobium sp. TZ2]